MDNNASKVSSRSFLDEWENTDIQGVNAALASSRAQSGLGSEGEVMVGGGMVQVGPLFHGRTNSAPEVAERSLLFHRVPSILVQAFFSQ